MMVQRVQWRMHEGALGRYRKGGRDRSQEPENGPRSARAGLWYYPTVSGSSWTRPPTGPLHLATRRKLDVDLRRARWSVVILASSPPHI